MLGCTSPNHQYTFGDPHRTRPQPLTQRTAIRAPDCIAESAYQRITDTGASTFGYPSTSTPHSAALLPLFPRLFPLQNLFVPLVTFSSSLFELCYRSSPFSELLPLSSSSSPLLLFPPLPSPSLPFPPLPSSSLLFGLVDPCHSWHSHGLIP